MKKGRQRREEQVDEEQAGHERRQHHEQQALPDAEQQPEERAQRVHTIERRRRRIRCAKPRQARVTWETGKPLVVHRPRALSSVSRPQPVRAVGAGALLDQRLTFGAATVQASCHLGKAG